MAEATLIPQAALKYEVEVTEEGRVELPGPFSPGEHVIVFVVKEADSFDDLLKAAQSSLDFWHNPFDAEDWDRVD